jgi:hypothetical protein
VAIHSAKDLRHLGEVVSQTGKCRYGIRLAHCIKELYIKEDIKHGPLLEFFDGKKMSDAGAPSPLKLVNLERFVWFKYQPKMTKGFLNIFNALGDL